MTGQLKLLVKKWHPKAELPEYGSSGAAAFDLPVLLEADYVDGVPSSLIDRVLKNGQKTWNLKQGRYTVLLQPGATGLFRTGLGFAVPAGYAMLLWDRSGTGLKYGVHKIAGVIDSDYRGEVIVAVTNYTAVSTVIGNGDKLVQALIQRVEAPGFELVDELPPTDRDTCGFGSTDKGGK